MEPRWWLARTPKALASVLACYWRTHNRITCTRGCGLRGWRGFLLPLMDLHPATTATDAVRAHPCKEQAQQQPGTPASTSWWITAPVFLDLLVLQPVIPIGPGIPAGADQRGLIDGQSQLGLLTDRSRFSPATGAGLCFPGRDRGGQLQGVRWKDGHAQEGKGPSVDAWPAQGLAAGQLVKPLSEVTQTAEGRSPLSNDYQPGSVVSGSASGAIRSTALRASPSTWNNTFGDSESSSTQ